MGQHCTGKTLYNVVQEPPGNIRPKKVPFNVALILLGQDCTGKNFLQWCRQHSTGKNPVQHCLDTLGITLQK